MATKIKTFELGTSAAHPRIEIKYWPYYNEVNIVADSNDMEAPKACVKLNEAQAQRLRTILNENIRTTAGACPKCNQEHSPEAIRIAKILMGEREFMQTKYGRKTECGVTAIIDGELYKGGTCG